MICEPGCVKTVSSEVGYCWLLLATMTHLSLVNPYPVRNAFELAGVPGSHTSIPGSQPPGLDRQPAIACAAVRELLPSEL
jgi:hypothetical protein